MGFPHGLLFPMSHQHQYLGLGPLPFPYSQGLVWSLGYFLQWVVMTPDGGQAAVAASSPWQAEGEMSVIDPFIVMRFYHLFNSPKKVFSLWILEKLWDAGRIFDQEDFPISSKCLTGKQELNSLEEAPSV